MPDRVFPTRRAGAGYSATAQTVLRWQVAIAPPTLEDEVADLAESITELVQGGSIELSTAEPLITKLEAVQTKANQGNATAAGKLLDAFIRQVEAFERARKLSSADAASLIAAATAAQQMIGSVGA